MPRADGHADERAVAGVIARHLVAGNLHGEIRAAVDAGSVGNALAERFIKLALAACD